MARINTCTTSRQHSHLERILPEGKTLSAGNYEWPFELVVSGSWLRVLKGLDDAHANIQTEATYPSQPPPVSLK